MTVKRQSVRGCGEMPDVVWQEPSRVEVYDDRPTRVLLSDGSAYRRVVGFRAPDGLKGRVTE